MYITSAKRIEKMKRLNATEEKPYIVCATCGLATDKVMIRNPVIYRKKRKYAKRRGRVVQPAKRWKRVIRKNVERSDKEVFFSYVMMECLSRKHKLTIRKKPFSSKLVSMIK